MAELHDTAVISNEIAREILEINTKILVPVDALEKIKSWQTSLRQHSTAAGEEKVAPPSFSAALDAGLKKFIDSRQPPNEPPPGFDEALEAGLAKLLEDTGVTLPEMSDTPPPKPEDFGHRPSSKKVGKLLGFSREHARQRIHQTRLMNRLGGVSTPNLPSQIGPAEIIQKKIKKSLSVGHMSPGTVVEVELDNGERDRASIIDFIKKTRSYRVSFADFSVITVPATKIKRVVDLTSSSKSDPVMPSAEDVPELGPPSNERHSLPSQRPDVKPPPKVLPSGDNSKWISKPPPPNDSPTASSEQNESVKSDNDFGPGEDAIALFPYHGLRGDELTVEVGDNVTVLQRFNDGWVLGRLTQRPDKVGVLPGNYLEPPGSAAANAAVNSAAKKFEK